MILDTSPPSAALSGVDISLDLILQIAMRIRGSEMMPLPVGMNTAESSGRRLLRFEEDSLIELCLIRARRLTITEASLKILNVGGETSTDIVRLRSQRDILQLAHLIVNLASRPEIELDILECAKEDKPLPVPLVLKIQLAR